MNSRTRTRRSVAAMPNRPRRPQGERAPRRSRDKRQRWLVIGLAALAAWAVTTLTMLMAWASFDGPGQGQRVELDWPKTLDDPELAAHRLTELGLVRSPRLLALYMRLSGVTLEPGPHLLNDALSPRDLLQRLSRRATRPSSRVTIPEGWHHLQIAERLDHEWICSSSAFRSAVTDRALLAELGLRAESAEGYLFPASYDLGLDSDPKNVVRLLVRETKKRLAKLDREQGGALLRAERERRLTEHELLILASIVEKEAGHPEERPTIASVFFNRLSDPEFLPQRTLQSDPTAGYGCTVFPERAPSCQGYAGQVTPAMLRDAQNPYNTYRHPGLPPGPICNPGEAALGAVLSPAKTDFLFFVSRGDGRHTFSRSFADHNAAIERSRR